MKVWYLRVPGRPHLIGSGKKKAIGARKELSSFHHFIYLKIYERKSV
jgi:hypothetical protein